MCTPPRVTCGPQEPPLLTHKLEASQRDLRNTKHDNILLCSLDVKFKLVALARGRP